MPTAIPTSSTIEEVVLPIGSQRPGMASSEIAEITAVPASSNGMPAAISAPNTTSSRTSETGIEVTSALRKSWLVMLPVTRSRLASPASSMVSPGWRAAMAATAFMAGAPAAQATGGERRGDAARGVRPRPQRRDHLADRLADLRVLAVGLARDASLDEHRSEEHT